MAMTNRDRVERALQLLRDGLAPFVEREIQQAIDQRAVDMTTVRQFAEDPLLAQKPLASWDILSLLKLMWETWNDVFKRTLGHQERSLVSELREWRNKWAHQEAFTSDDTYRVLDSAIRLLSAISAPQVQELEHLRRELLRVRFEEQVRAERRKVGGSLVEAAAAGALKPWREVITPHPDVASGRYQQAEFAADLWLVYRGEADREYQNPVEFFRRTYLTESLKRLLINALRRLSGADGDPVIQLQTNFGGGKTHAMIALYHLCSGIPPAELPGVEELISEAQVEKIPRVRRVVLVGSRISPGNPTVKPDGTVVRTLWGELAWQLGFAAGGITEAKKAYARVAADDKHATSPGDALRELFNAYGPCLILIDEWVAYARQLHDAPDLPGGTFDTQFTFAQALTESVRGAKNCLLALSLPASGTPEDIEVGGVRGREALDRLHNVIGRIESPWRPATAEETFEIVRRRLFEPITDPEKFKARDVTARAFADLYRTQKKEFPPECSEADYEQHLRAAYPIHPELFVRLYEDWSSIERFHRTRGVLRFMAAVIHTLWERGDRNPMILPSTVPMDDPRVQFELTRYLSDDWVPVIERDVDGPNSLPVRLDAEVSNLGRYHACRRVARTIYIGSAPLQHTAHRGLDDRRVRLGCVMPGESPAIFGDAMRRLASESTHLYQDGTRYWYSTQPTVTKEAESRAAQLRREPDKVAREIERRIREVVHRHSGDFARIHDFPRSPQDVPDDLNTRLVILGIDHPHTRGEPESPALSFAKQILESRDSSPRLYKNTLVFLAADRTRLQDLEDAVCRYLAWESIIQDIEVLNLSPHQQRQAETQREESDRAATARLPETYQWLLVPTQDDPQGDIKWQELRLQGNEGLAVRASRKLKDEDKLRTKLAGTLLRMELDRIPLWRGNHVEIRQLVQDFARYLYLPRLKNPSVLIEAVKDGVALLSWEHDSFAYADSFDQSMQRYRGLRVNHSIALSDTDPSGLLVKPEVAKRQLEEEKKSELPSLTQVSEERVPAGTKDRETKAQPTPRRRFHGSVELDPIRVGSDAARIAEEVIAHLASLPGANVRVILEIEANVQHGVPDRVIRIVTENCRTLKFTDHGFEEE